MSKKLTQQMIDDLPFGRDQLIFDETLPGFAVRITSTAKRYVAKGRIGGKRRYLPIGDATKLKLSDARREARPVLDAMRDGHDPEAAREARERAAAAGQTTIRELGERWMTEVVRVHRKPRTIDDYASLLRIQINPHLGDRPVQTIDKDEIRRWHVSMKTTPTRANRALGTLKTMLNYSEDIRLRAQHTNPATRIPLFRERKRARYLTDDEIATAAHAINDAEAAGKIGVHAAAALRLALLTGARSGELTAARWSYFSHNRRVIELPDSKNNEARTIHLSEAAVQVIAGIPRVGPYIIKGGRKDQPYTNLSHAWIVARKFGGLDDVRLHDLRHSFASLAVRKNISLKVIGELLGHKIAATTNRYAHLAFDAAAAVNEQLGAAMTEAIAKRPAPSRIRRYKASV